MRWTDDELRELVALWPTNSAKQIAERLHRPRWAIWGKAKRLRAEGVLPDGVHKHFDVVPVKARPRPVRSTVKKRRPSSMTRCYTSRCSHAHCSSLTTPVAAGRSARFQDRSCFAAAQPGGVVPIARIIFRWRRKADCGLRVLKLRYPPDVRRSLSREGVCGGCAAPMPELDGGMRN
jgi:hypothetical protein